MHTGRKAVAELQPLRKKRVLSVRVTEGEMGEIQQLMDTTRMSASQLIRDALLNYRGTRGDKAPQRSAGSSR